MGWLNKALEEDDFPIDGFQHAKCGSEELLLRLKRFHPELDVPGMQDIKIRQRWPIPDYRPDR